MIPLFLQDTFYEDHAAEYDGSDNDDNCPSESFSSASTDHRQASQNTDKDLILVKLFAISPIIPVGESFVHLFRPSLFTIVRFISSVLLVVQRGHWLMHCHKYRQNSTILEYVTQPWHLSVELCFMTIIVIFFSFILASFWGGARFGFKTIPII